MKLLFICSVALSLAGFSPCLGADKAMKGRGRLLAEKFKKLGIPPFEGFYLLCAVGDASQVREAIMSGADVNAGDPEHGQTPPLAVAAGHNPDPEVIEALLQAGADIDFSSPASKWGTVLNMCVARNSGNTPAVEFMMEAGADPNKPNREGIVPLHLAANNLDRPTIRALLEAGAKPEATDKDGDGILHYAFRNRGSNAEALKDSLDILLSTGIDVNMRNADQETPLHHFARWAEIESDAEADAYLPVLRELLRRGADLHAQDKRGRAPIHEVNATAGLSAHKLKLLVELGSDINARGYNGTTMLMQRAHAYDSVIGRIGWLRSPGKIESEERYHIDAFTALIEMGADPDLTDDEGKNAADRLSDSSKKALLESPVGRRVIPVPDQFGTAE